MSGPFCDSEWEPTFKHDVVSISSSNSIGLSAGRVIIPQFEVYSSPRIKIDDILGRRFFLIDRKNV